jgi:hypothetical protein
MFFDVALSEKSLLGLVTQRLSALQDVCLGLPKDLSVLFDRIDLFGTPELVPIPDPTPVSLADGSAVQAQRLSLRQRFNIFAKQFDGKQLISKRVTESGLVDGTTNPTDSYSWLDLSLGVRVKTGDAQICVEYRGYHIPEWVQAILTSQGVDVEAEVKKAAHTTCVTIPIGDILGQLSTTLATALNLKVPLFASTDVIAAGMAVVPGPPLSMVIRMELDNVEADSLQEWKAFFDGVHAPNITDLGTQVGAAPGSVDWMLVIDRRLLSRLVSVVAHDFDAKHDDIELDKPAATWHPSADLVVLDGLMPKVLATGLPTLTATIDGTADDACSGLYGLVKNDVGFTAKVNLAVMVPAQNALRFYSGVSVGGVSFGDTALCAAEGFPTSLLGAFLPAFGRIGTMLVALLRWVTGAFAADPGGLTFSLSEKCHDEYGLNVCELPWISNTSIGTFNLTHATGNKTGLVLLGSVKTAPLKVDPPLKQPLTNPFVWHKPCTKVTSKDDLRAYTFVWTSASRCAFRMLNDPGDYQVVANSPYELQVYCIKPISQVPTVACRLLVATVRGVALVAIQPPPADVSWDDINKQVEVGCLPQYTAGKNWQIPKDHPAYFVVHPDLVVAKVVLAGLTRPQVVSLRADGRVVATSRPGADGLVTLSAELPEETRGAQLSVDLAGRRWRPTRFSVHATFDLWRHAGTVGLVGEFRGLAGPVGDGWWLASSQGLLRVELVNERPVVADRIPMAGISQIVMTEYGLGVAGEHGVRVVDPDSGAMLAEDLTGPVRMLARRGATLFAAHGDGVRSLSLIWAPDTRGRRRSLAIRQTGMHKVADVQSGLVAGQFLVLRRANRLDLVRLESDRTLRPARSIPLAGVSELHPAVGPKSAETVAATADHRAVLLRIDELATSRRSRAATVDLPAVPWFVGAWRLRDTLVRVGEDGRTVSVYRLLRTVDLLQPTDSIVRGDEVAVGVDDARRQTIVGAARRSV